MKARLFIYAPTISRTFLPKNFEFYTAYYQMLCEICKDNTGSPPLTRFIGPGKNHVIG